MPSNHLILCHPLFLLPSIFPSLRVFSNESALCIRRPGSLVCLLIRTTLKTCRSDLGAIWVRIKQESVFLTSILTLDQYMKMPNVISSKNACWSLQADRSRFHFVLLSLCPRLCSLTVHNDAVVPLHLYLKRKEIQPSTWMSVNVE